MAILTISLLLSVVEQFLSNFCSAPLENRAPLSATYGSTLGGKNSTNV
jgi:hypothetical protein